MTALLLNLHIIAACLLAGGNLLLALVVLPQARAAGEPRLVLAFQRRFFMLAAPALLVQIATGPMLAVRWVPEPSHWLPTYGTLSAHIFAKLFTFAVLLVFFVHGRMRLGAKVGRGDWGFRAIAWHVYPQAILAVCFVVLGVSIGLGG